jgi:uncharacterized protein
MSMPAAARLFVAFASRLRQADFLVGPDQTTAFLSAIDLLGPNGILDIRRAAHATLAPPPDRRAEFDALFDAHFLGAGIAASPPTEAERDEVVVRDSAPGTFDVPITDEGRESGQAAAATERLAVRRVRADSETALLRRFERALPEKLPRRRGYRKRADRRGPAFDLRQSLRKAVNNDGEMMQLERRRRRTRQRKLLLLIDVSGSMKERTDAHLRFAHALARSAEHLEVFTIGTRLTRVTKALRMKRREQALAAVSGLVADWDGGTRLGDSLQAFLAIPRFAGYARGAFVVVVSDGLERGDHSALTRAVARLAALAWRISWLTPLGADSRFVPETEALKSILPLIDDLADGSSTERLCAHLLNLSRMGTAVATGSPRHAA